MGRPQSIKTKYFSDSNFQSGLSPNITITKQKRSEYRLDWNPLNGFTQYQLIISNDGIISGDDSVIFTNDTFYVNTAVSEPHSDFFVQVRGYNTEEDVSDWSELTFVEIEPAIPLPDLSPSPQADDGLVSISYTDTATGLGQIDIERRLIGGQWGVLATNIGSSPYQDFAVVNGTTYEYRVRALPSSFDYSETVSTVVQATPVVVIQKVSEPVNLSVSWSTTVNGSGTFSFEDGSSGVSEEYDVFINDVLQTTLTAPTTSFAFSGLAVLMSYKFGVKAKAIGYVDSDTSEVTRTAPDLSSPTISVNSDHGGNPYYKPLDGRRYEGWNFPLIDYTPLDESAFNLLNTGLTYSDYPNGVTQIVSKSNDGSGIVVNGAFSDDDIGKDFCGLSANLNGGESTMSFIDEFIPSEVTSRYSKVIYRSGDYILVDFEYNGGDLTTSQPIKNGYGYIFHNNSSALNSAFSDWKNLTRPNTVRLSPLTRTGYVLTAYVAPELEPLIIDVAKDFYLNTGTEASSRIKFGIEDRYISVLDFEDGAQKYSKIGFNRFRIANGWANKAVSNNVQWISPHTSQKWTDNQAIAYGNMGGGGMFIARGVKNMSEYNEISDGGNIEPQFTFPLVMGSIAANGSFTGTGSLFDVDEFGFVYFSDADFAGTNALGTSGGAVRGSTYRVIDNCMVRMSSEYAESSQEFDAIFTDDYTGVNDTGGTDDPSTISYLPNRCIGITSFEGNFYNTRYMGGNNRTAILHTDKFVFPSNVKGGGVHSYYTPFYNNNTQWLDRGRTTGSSNGAFIGDHGVSAKKMVVDWEIPRANECYTIGRVSLMSKDFGQPPTGIGTNADGNAYVVNSPLDVIFKNAIISHINWTIVLNKYVNQATTDDIAYISNSDKRPKIWQIDDTFRICSWIELDDTTGITVGQSITGDQSGATATVHRVDNYLHTNRVYLKSASQSFDGDTSVNLSAFSVTSASTYDPTTVYTCSRSQRILYGQEGYSEGCAESNRNRQGALYGFKYIVSPDMPEVINGKEDSDNDITLDVECLSSGAEILYDGVPRRMTHNYIGVGGIGGNGYTFYDTTNKKILGSRGQAKTGYGRSYGGSGEQLITGYRAQSWTYTGERVSWAAYNRGELTWYIKAPSDWKQGAWRNRFASLGTGSQQRPAGRTSYGTVDLSRYSKGFTLVGEVSGFSRFLETEKGSTASQFDQQYDIYQNQGIVTSPAYATREEMLPTNESAPYYPKIRAYGQTAVNYVNGTNNEYTNESGQNIVLDTDEANAPPIPKTLRDVLDSLP